MAVYNDYKVEYYNTGISAWVEVTDVVSLNCTVGRQLSTDAWQISSTIVRARYPNGFNTPYSNLDPGTWIRWFAPDRASNKPTWTGFVKNVRNLWDMPWDGVDTGNGDQIEIEMEGNAAVGGRATRNFTYGTFPFRTVFDVLDVVFVGGTDVTNNGFTTDLEYPDGRQTFLSWTLQAIAGIQARLVDGIKNNSAWNGAANDIPAYWVAQIHDNPEAPVTFSDTTNDATHRKYYEIEFDGVADEYFTEISVEPHNGEDGRAAVGGEPYRTLSVSTYNATEAAADYVAAYLLEKYKTPTIGLSRIRARSSGQHTQNLDTLGVTDLELGYLIKYRVAVELRGQTFYGQIEGVQWVADLDETTVTYFLSPLDEGSWFTLDSADYGVLDTDRLGFA